MVFRRPAPLWLAVAGVAAFLLFFYDLDGVGLIGPDEPRYAAIGREMAESGDFITPRLWGEAWFEKPPLLFWLTAGGFALGLGEELAPRLPVVLLSVGFLVFYFLALRNEFGARAAAFSTAVLGSCAAWIAYTRVAVMDVPLAATFSAAVLLCLPWIARGETRRLPAAGAMLGLAVLAKGLVPLVLVLPLAWFARKRWRDVWMPALTFIAVAAPWYALVTLRYGRAFLADFIIEHHLGRFATDSLRHEQPFWFYIPVMLALLFPWTPLAALLVRTNRDARRRVLLAILMFGLVFFSASTNKLPGYLLPLMPAAAALAGIAVAEAKRPRWPLAACVAMLGAMPVIAALLPDAVERGVTRASVSGVTWAAVAPALIAAAIIAWKGRRHAAVALVAFGMAAGAAWTANRTFSILDGNVSARAFWRREASRQTQLCVETAHRSWRYNLNYYSKQPLPDCSSAGRPFRIEQAPERGARISESAR